MPNKISIYQVMFFFLLLKKDIGSIIFMDRDLIVLKYHASFFEKELLFNCFILYKMVESIFLDQFIPGEIIKFIYFLYFKLKMEEISEIMRTKISCGRKSSVICYKGLLYITGAWNPFDHANYLFDKFTYCGIEGVDFVGHSNSNCYAIFLKNNKAIYLSEFSNLTTKNDNIYITFVKEEINCDDDIVEIKSGDAHALILSKSGVLFGWGNNDRGQLGLGSRQFQHSFKQIVNNVISFECGASHTLVLTNQGLFACGDNHIGIDYDDILTLTLINIDNVISFACGYRYSLVLTNEGLFHCGKDYGLIKNKKFNSTNIAFFKIELPISNIIKLSCADKYSLILTTKGLYQLRFTYDEFENSKYFDKHRINNVENVLDINCGKEYDIILTKEGLFGRGLNSSYQLGLGDNRERFYYQKIEVI